MKWAAWFGIMLSLIFGLATISQVDFHHLAAALRSAHYFPLVLAAVTLVSTHLVRAWRWQYLLMPVKSVRLLPLLSATAIGFLANMLLPAHAGEVVRAYVLSRREGVSTMAALATIVVERVADIVSILLILIPVLVFATVPPELAPIAAHLRTGGYISALLCGGLIGSLWFFRAQTARVIQWLSGCLVVLPQRWRHRLMTALASFALGLQALNQGWHMITVLVLSLLLWAVVAFSNVFVFYGFELQLPLTAAFFILVVQILGVVIPSSPGFIGTYHAAVVAGLAVFEVAPELALSIAIMMHAAFFFPFILVGLVFLWRESLSLRELRAVNVRRLG
jgi:uncharacterized protein (TIRG00374 family)